MADKKDGNRPVIAAELYSEVPGEEAVRVKCLCGRFAVVHEQKKNKFYCPRCWEMYGLE
jgi:hypothetical protein